MALMKLAFLCNNMKSTNGVERVLSQRLSLLADSGEFDVYLITYNQYGAPFSFPISDNVHHIDLATRYIERCSYHGLYQYLDRYVSKRRCTGAIRDCLYKLNPDVITCMDMEIMDLNVVLALKIDATKVVECHCGLSAYYGNLYRINNPYKRNKNRRLKDKIVRAVSMFDKIIVLTEKEKKEWLLGDKVICIPNMLATCPPKMFERNLLHKRVISVGRYAYQKGYDLLIDAWNKVNKKHADWSLHIYGSHDGDFGDYKRLIKKINYYDIANVYLHETISDVVSEYANADIYVMSSRYESFGLVLIEAMSCGLPVISFGCKYGPCDIIDDGRNGIIVPQENVDKMSDAICSLIENENKRILMSKNAIVAANNYMPEKIIYKWHGFYRSLC